MNDIEIRNAVKLCSKLGKIKQQRLYCFRTKKLTLIGAIAVSFMMIQLTQKMIEKYIEVKNEETN